MKMPKMKPCPFCGGKAHVMKIGYPHWVYCEDCGAKLHGGAIGEAEGEKASINAWNTRSPGWISCSERMPEKDGNYLCYTEDGDFLQAYYCSAIDDDFPFGIWEQHYDSGTLGWVGEEWVAYDVITHWMPLPEPPKGARP